METAIEINATAERVWREPTDFDAYSAWNTTICKASGALKAGGRVQVYFQPGSGRKIHVFGPELMTVDPCRGLRWLGKPRFPGLFDREHSWIINRVSETT